MPTRRVTTGEAPRLVVTLPSSEIGTWELAAGSRLVVGRTGDIVLDVHDVSRRHAGLHCGPDGVWIVDLGSRNGTTVNGRSVPAAQTPVLLAHGDTLGFGSVRATYQETAVLPAPLPPRVAPVRTETTRYLSATTQLDPEFCDLAMDRIVDEPYRALSPTYGVDLAVVAKWALAIRRRRLLRDTALTGLLLLTVALEATLQPWRHPAEVVSRVWWVAVVGLLAAWLVIAAERWITDYQVVERSMTAGRFRLADAPDPVSAYARKRLRAVAERASGNLVVFSEYSPFVGSGERIDTWSFAIDVGQGAPDDSGGRRTPRPFTSGDLHEALTQSLRQLDLPGLRVDERLFVSGYDVQRERRLLPDRLAPPLTAVPAEVVRDKAGGPDTIIRSYVCVEAQAWSGQLVVTMFIRAVRVRGSLFLEGETFALLPLRGSYCTVDAVPRHSRLGAVSSALAATALPAPADLLLSPFRTAAQLHRRSAARAKRDGQSDGIRRGAWFDYGALPSLREAAAGDEWRHYFLQQDATMFVQVTHERLLKSIGAFLQEHDIDLSEFARHQTTINNTVNNDNSMRVGNVSGTGVAVGHGAGAQGGQQRST
ncbi:FHA domain-containing protein [Streptomyces venezuelae]|uniref:FHA domain-containing protein n=1 Tax=Streptomyces venezuelae TaxID=54571 RepID=UPI001685C03B|nr:FHA domain-containing protein [Streptomyces venezuelae]